MSAAHTWRLVGPWYRWPRPGHPDDGRVAPPAIQKFAGADFITRFLAEPQRSLQYDEQIDVVQSHDLVPARGLSGKLATLFALDARGQPLAKGSPETAYRARLAPGALRKLFQSTHDRHYLVCCELHCDEPGFPRVARQRVCQAGFVLRRRRSVLPPGLDAAAVEAQAAPVRHAEADWLDLCTLQATAEDAMLTAAQRDAAARRLDDLAAQAGLPDGASLLASRRADLARQRQGFVDWQRAQGVRTEIDGWFPLGHGSSVRRGEWRLLDAVAQAADITSGEQTYPLHALVPDPRLPTHDAAGRCFWYGVVPTQDLQHDVQGQPHLDDLHTYELRCFVRAHHDCPGRRGLQPDCHGPLTWSRATEAFRLAPHFDVQGSANRPVTIKMPDLRDLAAQAAARPRGRLSPVRFVQPQHLSPKELGGEAVCSFSIPLITIIALFLLNLFLPVVVFLFQVWFLLAFRFCIPPQIKIAMDVDAALAVTPPGVDFEADLEVQAQGLADSAEALRKLFLEGGDDSPQTLVDRIHEDTGNDDEIHLDDLDNNALASIGQNFADAKALAPAADGGLQPPEVGEVLLEEPHVDPVWSPRRSA
ncbi:hypothetical protein KAK06_00865 [Ideonella sp. 4Y11]|uniref:Uncharacterized protein n=1 Tax=Ideonella aquatica TaxID=2824119 RepID=A0A940YJP7_9BURK|nr:hypothetical protein [Ideonella aquatica]MBQ0957496.1 hypothetical protein [Ideonella aquatica]